MAGTGREPDPIRILIVDPYRYSREGLSASLRGGGWIVESVGGTREAITKMKDGRFDVAVIDLDLPPAYGVPVSGWDLARIFRGLNPRMVLVLVATEWDRDVKREAQRLDQVQMLEKPISPVELRAIVRTLPRAAAERLQGGRR
jgi:CheY-like chemotaxis protein